MKGQGEERPFFMRAGGYRQEDKQVVMCACNNKEMYLVEQAVKEIDDKSFMIMLESNEVLEKGSM
ncbi:MAG: DUF2179 domain-containing protein [Lachnospiraceae bacterium]